MLRDYVNIHVKSAMCIDKPSNLLVSDVIAFKEDLERSNY